MSENLPQTNTWGADTLKRGESHVEKAMYVAMVTAAVQAAMNLSNLCSLIGKPETATFVDENAAKPLAGLLVDIYTEKNAADVNVTGQN